MGILDRYILRTATVAFLATLLSLTAVIWITQALREFDLLTAKRQTIMVFLLVTGLSIPALITIIAPFGLFIATIYALNKLNGDSELIVMSAAGLAPSRLLRPFILLGVAVSLLVASMTLWAMPASFRDIRDLVTQIRADFIGNIVREGQFTTLDVGMTFHFRERSGDALLGIFMQDRRDPAKVNTYIAERGQTIESNDIPYLVLEKGSIQREIGGTSDASIVAFERYAIDLSQFGGDGETVVYKPRERSTMELLTLDRTDLYVQQVYGRFRAELHERFSGPLYPFAFLAIALAALGTPRTTRQGRGVAIAAAIGVVVLVRIAGFAVSSLVVRTEAAVPLAYAVPIAGALGGLAWFFTGGIRMPRRAPRAPARPAIAASP
jgi:lipopolysaccharide export system permease protein